MSYSAEVFNTQVASAILPLHPEFIPDTLKSRPRWVLWRLEVRDGETTKRPYQTSGERAKVNDPTTWTDFDTALAAYLVGGYSGLGIVLTADDDLSGVDLDDCLDPETGELDPVAARIVAMLPTYCEVSPRGHGLRLFALGRLPQGGRRKGKVEIYESGRYLTVTGHRFNGHDSIAECTDELAAVHKMIFPPVDTKPGPARAAEPSDLDDAALLDKARHSQNGDAFDALWSGDTSAHNGDHSAADLALLNTLAFWTGKDSNRMDQLFRQSGLMRDKWDESHTADGQTYGQMSIDKAISDCRDSYSGKKSNTTRHNNKSESNESIEKTDCLFSDYGNAVILRDYLADELVYTPGLGWMAYDDECGVWSFEPGTEKVREKVMRTLRKVWTDRLEAIKVKQFDLSKQLKGMDNEDPNYNRLISEVKAVKSNIDKTANWLTQCESAYRIRACLDVADGILFAKPDVWDSHPDILVCKNGVLNLETGELMPHSPLYRSTKSAGAHFDPNATHPAWDKVIELLKSEGDRYELIHQFCGSGLHHENPTEQMMIAQGDGGTGKGTLLTGIHNALGDYVATIEINTLLESDWRRQSKSAPREDLLKLRGARFVYPSIEPPKGAKLDDGTIKALTTSDVISARYPHVKQSISFVPVFKLFMQTNFPLQTNFDDPGMKRRVIICPFNNKPEHPDPSIKSALMNDPNAKAAVLRWQFDGYRKWRASGFRLPDSYYASTATEAYWSEMDPFAQFSNECLIFAKGAKTSKGDMTDAFKEWRETSGRREATLRYLPSWLKKKGIYEDQEHDSKTRTRIWVGVELTNTTNNTSITSSKFTRREFSSPIPTPEFARNDVRNVRNVQTPKPLSPVDSDLDGRDVEEF